MRFEGKGSMTNRELVIRTFESNKTKNGKNQYLDVQVASEDPIAKDQNNLHVVTQRGEYQGKTTYSNGAPYSMEQVDKLKEAAGEKGIYENPEKGETVLRLKGSLMPSSSGAGLVINTNKPLEASAYEANDKTMASQIEHTKAVTAERKEAAAAKAKEEFEAETAAPEAEAETEVEMS